MLVRLNEPLLSPQGETGRSGAESIQNPGGLTLGSRGDDSQKIWAAVPKWGTGKWWALANMETLPQGAGPDGRKPSQFCRDPKAPIAFHAPFLFIDPTPGTPATKEKAEVSEICQHMT